MQLISFGRSGGGSGGGGGGPSIPAQTSPYAVGNATSAVTFDFSGNGQFQTVNWNVAATTITLPNPTYLGTYTVKSTNTSGTTVALTYPANVKGPNGTKPQPTTGASALDEFKFSWDGTNWSVALAYPALS